MQYIEPSSKKTDDEPTPIPPKADPDPPRPAEPARPKRPRGFAAMDRRKVSLIASKGGKAAHAAGKAHEFTSAEAREAGRKGGARKRAHADAGDATEHPERDDDDLKPRH